MLKVNIGIKKYIRLLSATPCKHTIKNVKTIPQTI